MADILREVFGIFSKRYRDMGDGTHAEVVAIGGEVTLDMPETPLDVTGPLTNAQLRAADVKVTMDGEDVDIASIAVPAGSPITGQAVIAVTGTAVRLIAASTPLPGGSVFLTALSTNTTQMTGGGSAVTNGIGGAGNGLILGPGNNGVIFTDNANKVYVNGTAGAIVSWSAG